MPCNKFFKKKITETEIYSWLIKVFGIIGLADTVIIISGKGTAAPTPIPPLPSGQTVTPTRVTPTGQSVTPTGVTPTGVTPTGVTPTGQSVRPSGSPTTVVTPPKSGSNAAEAFVGLIAMALCFALII